MHPPKKIYGGGWQYETCRPRHFLFSSVKYQFYIHFQNKYQLGGGGSSTRPPYWGGLDPTGWLSSPKIPSSLRLSIVKVTDPLTAWRYWTLPIIVTECYGFKLLRFVYITSDDDEETVNLASATIIFSSCTVVQCFFVRSWESVSFCVRSRLPACIVVNTWLNWCWSVCPFRCGLTLVSCRSDPELFCFRLQNCRITTSGGASFFEWGGHF